MTDVVKVEGTTAETIFTTAETKTITPAAPAPENQQLTTITDDRTGTTARIDSTGTGTRNSRGRSRRDGGGGTGGGGDNICSRGGLKRMSNEWQCYDGLTTASSSTTFNCKEFFRASSSTTASSPLSSSSFCLNQT